VYLFSEPDSGSAGGGVRGVSGNAVGGNQTSPGDAGKCVAELYSSRGCTV
jgi:hypothetical protein